MKQKLSKVQERAYKKLKKHGGWECSYSLHESLSTMEALRRRGLIKSRGELKPGALWSPQTTIEFMVIKGK